MGVEGNLQDLGLASLVQTICLDRRKALLELKHGGEKGLIAFEDGNIVHAAAGTLTGNEAVFRLLSWTKGSFRLSDHIAIPRRTVTLPWNDLLMEGMRQLDEERANVVGQNVASHPPSYEVPPRGTSSEVSARESAYENEFLLTMSKLEQLTTRLNGPEAQKNPGPALQVLALMTNQVILLAERTLGAQVKPTMLKDLLTQAGEQYPRVQLLSAQGNRVVPGLVAKLYSDWATGRAGRRELFTSMALGLVDVIDKTLAEVLSYPVSPLIRSQCEDVRAMFLSDVRQAITRVQV